MCVKIFAKKMITMNNNLKTPYQVLHEDNNPINYEDYYSRNANADCCFINFLCFLCMVTGLYCLFTYDLNANPHKKIYSNESNITGVFNSLNMSSNFSVSIVS